jgi:hypothetical protein
MKHFHATAALVLATLCSGCVLRTAPKGDEGFANIRGLEALVGCYTNIGEGHEKRYLSAAIWPTSDIQHAGVSAIQVDLEPPSSLRVSARLSGATIKESVFVEGKDFHLSSGGIERGGGLMVSLAYPAGNPFLGLAHESVVLGIDKSGNARVQEAGTFGGVAFLIIPVAGHVRDAFRFPRNPDLCK